MKKAIFTVIALIFSCLVTLAIGEIATRVYILSQHGKMSHNYFGKIDQKLGWKNTNYSEKHSRRKDAAGNKYHVDIITDENGFRVYEKANPLSVKAKFFVIGDSYTYAYHASNSSTYYGRMFNNLPVDIVAYGGLGYGTLQEYMMIDHYLEKTAPDAIILQFASNDFINNSNEIESQSRWNNNGLRRPYYKKDGSIYYAFPGCFPRHFPLLREFANKNSAFLYFIFSSIDKIMADKDKSIETEIMKQGTKHLLFSQAIKVTEMLLKKIRARVPAEIEIYAFCVDRYQPFYNVYRQLLSKTGIIYIDGIPQAIREAEKKGVVTRAADKTHWNETAHRLAGDVLVRYFNSHGLQ